MQTYGGGGEWVYSSTHWLRYWMEVNGLLHVPAALPPTKEHRQQSDRRLVGPHGLFGHCGGKILACRDANSGRLTRRLH
jgi:hypothetical protein